MDYNNYNQPPQSSNIICPQITAWIFFVIYLFNITYGSSGIVSIVIQLCISLSITIGIKNRNYGLYKAGLIISLVLSILGTLGSVLLLFLINSNQVNIKDSEKNYLYIVLIINVFIIWIQTSVYLCYKSAVENLCNFMGGLNPTPIIDNQAANV